MSESAGQGKTVVREQKQTKLQGKENLAKDYIAWSQKMGLSIKMSDYQSLYDTHIFHVQI